jgi:pyruvate/2-oxoglutarate dehydrogenase complex dihydrolipoamide dehydrogenase (E3) component
VAKKKHIQSDSSFDTIVIGSGPAGSTAAELLALAGQKVAIVEAEQIGGECLNYGCIPTKSMLSSAHLFSTIKSQKTISNQGLLKLKLSRLISKAESDILRTGAPSLGAGLSDAGVKILNGRAYFLDSSRVDVAGKSYAAKNFIIASGGDVRIPKTPGLDGIDPLTYKNFLQRVKLKVPRSSYDYWWRSCWL